MKQIPTTLKALRAALDAKEITAREVTQHYLDRIAETQDTVNSFITVTAEQALAEADRAQKEIDAGNAGPMTGIPYAAKDLFTTKGIRTTAGSNMLTDYIPPYSASVITELDHANAPMLGKTNLDEFAMGTTGEYSAYGATKNPYDLQRVAGGSSAGSAASVAAGQTPWAWGTDTGGSIRLPAAFTHTVGYKPTYGTFSRYGVIAMASSLDTLGTFTRNVEDAAYILEHVAKQDGLDTTVHTTPGQFAGLTDGLAQLTPKSLKIGIPKEFMQTEGMQPAVKEAFEKAVEALKAAGVEIVEVSLPNYSYAIYAYYVITPSEVSSNMARYDGLQFGARADGESLTDVMKNAREIGFGAEVKRRILMGAYALSAGYSDRLYHMASKARTLIVQDFNNAFAHVDALICPPSPSIAFGLGENLNDPVAMWLADIFTVPMNLAGVPTVSVPGYLADGMPTGVQCIGPHGRDDIALSAAYIVESILHAQPPELAV